VLVDAGGRCWDSWQFSQVAVSRAQFTVCHGGRTSCDGVNEWGNESNLPAQRGMRSLLFECSCGVLFECSALCVVVLSECVNDDVVCVCLGDSTAVCVKLQQRS